MKPKWKHGTEKMEIEIATENIKLIPKRKNVRTRPFTIKEKSGQQAFVTTIKFLSSINHFIKKGYELEAKKKFSRTHNLARSYNNPKALKGKYPNLEIDYSKVILSVGDMPQARFMSAGLHREGIIFKWDTELPEPECVPGDQVMLMAYFPEKEYGIYTLNGEKRHKGEHLLHLPASILAAEVHTYLSFISADHRSITNSNYLGQFTWHLPNTL